jgi:pre-mRNA-processing factor 19
MENQVFFYPGFRIIQYSNTLLLITELTSADFHPDGHLFAAGTSSAVQVFDVRSTALGARFDLSGSASSLNFSENGFWLALSVKDESTVQIWDLRKMAHIKSLEIGNRVDSIRWDYTGQFLAAAGPSGISVQSYSKPTKSWSEPLRSAVPAIATAWGNKANTLVSVNREGVLTVLGAKEE